MAEESSPFAAIKIKKPSSPMPDLSSPMKMDKSVYLAVAENFYYYSWQEASGRFTSTLKIQEWITNRLISQGKMDEGALVNKIVGDWGSGKEQQRETESEQALRSFINLDWERLKFWPQLRDQVISRLEEVDWDAICTAIDPEAGDDKEKIKWDLWAKAQNEEWIKEMEAISKTDMGQKPDAPMPIQTRQDLEIWMKTGFKHNFEAAMQVAVKSAMNGGDMPWKLLQKMHYEDIVDIGRFNLDIVTNPIDHTTTVKYVDPVNAIVPEFRGHLLDQPDQIGYFETYTISQLMTMIDVPLTKEQKLKLIDLYKNYFGNATVPNGINSITNTDSENSIFAVFNVPVMKMYFSVSDRLKFVQGQGFLGEKFVAADKDAPVGEQTYADTGSEKGKATMKKKTVVAADLQYYEQLFWVIGTDIVFDYGKVLNQSRDVLKAQVAPCPMLTYVVNTASFTDRIRAFDEAANIAWLKIQQAKAAARPRGFTIDVSALANVSVDGKIRSRMAVQIFNNTGNLLWASKNFLTPEQAQGYKPIGELEGGLGRDYENWLNDLHFNIDSMKQVIGFNDVTSGSTPAERTGLGVSEMAVQGTQYSLQQILSGVGITHCRVCEQLAQKIQLQVRSGNLTVIENSLGKVITHILGMDVVSHRFAFEWQARPSKEMKQELMDAAKQALVNTSDPVKGGLNYNDYFYICDLINSNVDFKLVQLIFANIVEKNIQRQTQQQQATAQAQSQGNMQADQQKLQQQMAIDNNSHKNKMEEINLQGQWSLKNTQQKDLNSAHHTIIKGNMEQQHTILEHQLPPTTTKSSN